MKLVNSLKVKGIVIRKDDNGIGVVVSMEVVNAEGREKEKIMTTSQQQPPIGTK